MKAPGFRIPDGATVRGVNMAALTGSHGESLPTFRTEKEFQAAVIRLAESLGWLVYHTFDSRKSASGHPDLELVRERLIYAELKREDGKPTADQTRWLEALRRAGVPALLWRPSDWTAIVKTLESGRVC